MSSKKRERRQEEGKLIPEGLKSLRNILSYLWLEGSVVTTNTMGTIIPVK